MIHARAEGSAKTADRWSRAWRLAVIALCVLILCSCQGPSTPPRGAAAAQGGAYATLPPEAFTGPPPGQGAPPAGPPGMELGVPVPYSPTGPWSPPGISLPWPADEYVCDGGNAGPPIRVGKQGDVHGLNMVDTIAHFDTLDGRTLVEPSNRVCLYAPRFGAVRQVVDVQIDQNRDRAAGVFIPTKALVPQTTQRIGASSQDFQAIDEVGNHPAEIMRTRQGYGVMSSRLNAREFENLFRAYENVTVIRQGVLIDSEGAFLAKGVQAAVAWTHDQAVQILLDRQAASPEVGTEKLQMTYTINAPPAKPRLRLIKVASTPFAEPGDEVSFTLRFDNVGNQPIGNVTILDSLHTRLEYIPNSAQCSLNAQFSTKVNEGDSVVVRCELSDPLRPGKGGVLRFRCRVR